MTVDRSLLLKAILGLLSLVLLGIGCAMMFSEQISAIGELFLNHFGLWGVGLFTLITDSSPIPLTSEPVALMAMGANIPFWTLCWVMSLASHLGCLIGYSGGYFLGQAPWLKRRLEQQLPQLLDKGPQYAIRIVALGAALPIPYALTTWAAGVVKADLKKVILVSSLRWVKTVITLALLQGSWNLGQL